MALAFLSATFERIAARAERNPRRVLAVLIGLVLVLGALYSRHLGSELRYSDEREYWEIADSLVSGRGFRWRDDVAFRPPVYPLLMSLPRAFGSIFLARLLNFAFLGAAMALLYRLVAGFSRPLGGLIAAGWVLAYPILLYAAGTLYPQILAGCLALLFVTLVTAPKPAFFWAGISFGVLVLTVPSFGPLLLLVPLWLALNRRLKVQPVLILFGAAALPVALWTLRNYVALHAFVPVSTNSGLNLLLGNSEHATPSSGVNANIEEYLRASQAMSETERDAFYKHGALGWISENPGRALGLYLGKVAHYFSMNDQLATASEGGGARKLLATLMFIPLQAAALARLLLIKRFPLRPPEQLLFGFFLVNAPLAAVFFTRVRLRLPMDFCLLALLGGLIPLLAQLRPSAARAPDPDHGA